MNTQSIDPSFTVIGETSKYVLFISKEHNYLGKNGYKIYCKTFKEVIELIDKYFDCFIRIQRDEPTFLRVMIKSEKDNQREIEGCSNPELIDRIINKLNK